MNLHKTLAVTAALMGALALSTSAQAATRTVDDAHGDMKHGGDIRRVKVTNGHRVKIEIHHANLVRDFHSGTSGTVFIDTDAAHPGPEYLFAAGLYEGADYQLSRAEGWRATGKPLTCRHSLALDYAEEISIFRVGRKCLGSPDQVRVAVKTGGEKDGAILRDWLGSRRQLTEWVSQG